MPLLVAEMETLNTPRWVAEPTASAAKDEGSSGSIWRPLGKGLMQDPHLGWALLLHCSG